MNAIRSPQWVDFARLIFVSAIWGASFICNEIALESFTPPAMAAWRVLMASLVVFCICRWRGLSLPLDRHSIPLFFVIGILNSAAPFTLISWGQQTVDSATTALLIAASPFFTLLLSHFLSKDDRFSWNRMLGLAVGFLGIVVLFAGELVLGGNSLLGMFAVVCAAACYAMAGVLIRKLGKMHSLLVVAGSLYFGALILMPALFWFSPPWEQAWTPRSASAMVFLALISTALAYVVRTQIVQINGAVFMSNAGYLIPLFAVIWAWVFFSHTPSLTMWIAMGFVFSGIGLGQRKAVAK